MISWPIWIELRSFLHPNLQRYCQEKLLFHPLLTKNENLINWNKKSFFGERGLASTLPLLLPTHGCFSTVHERQLKTASPRVTSLYFRCSTFRHGHEMTANSPIIDEEKSKENIIIILMDVLTDRIIITIKSCNFSCELKLRISSRIIDHLRSYIKRSTQF